MAVFSIKRNDTLPYLEATLSDDSGPYDLTGATVLFVLRKKDCGDAIFKKEAVVVNAASGDVRYEWEDGDTTSAGPYVGEFEVLIAGKRWTFPSTGYLNVLITPDLG